MLQVSQYTNSWVDRLTSYVDFCITKPSLLVIKDKTSNPANESYIKQKRLIAEKIGITFKELAIDKQQIEQVATLSQDFDAVIVQYPFYDLSWDDIHQAMKYVKPSKDVDGLSAYSDYYPCTPVGIHLYMGALSKEHNFDLKKSKVIIIGRGKLVGEPLAQILHRAGISFEVFHSENSHLLKDAIAQLTSNDFVVCATNKHSLITAELYNPKCYYIDCGCENVNGKLLGNVDRALYSDEAKITPVPGGVGKLTTTMLMGNVAIAHQL